MKSLLSTLAAAATALLAQSASAVVINTDFTISFFNGPEAGNDYIGSLSYDDAGLTGSGSETIGPGGGFLSFDVTIDGTSFSRDDDDDFNAFPLLSFLQMLDENGQVRPEILQDIKSDMEKSTQRRLDELIEEERNRERAAMEAEGR